MRESTPLRLALFAATALSLCGLIPSASLRASDSRPLIVIAPLEHEVPNVGRGLAQMLRIELERGGRFRAEVLDPQSDVLETGAEYLLSGAVSYIGVTERHGKNDMGGELADLGRLTGNGDKVAQVMLDLTLADLQTNRVIGSFLLEGTESRRGGMPERLSTGWLGAVDFEGDELRRSAVGKAAYKASGGLLSELYAILPLKGELLAVSGGVAVASLGRESGIAAGDELTVLRGEPIANGAGEVVWESEQRVGSLQVYEVREGRCLCQIMDGTGIILEGDVVEPLFESEYYPMEFDTEE